MKANINDNPLKIVVIPNRYKRPNGIIIDGYLQLPDLQYEDGFRDVIDPTYDSETHRLGGLINVDDTVTYEVIAYTPEQIIENLSDAKDRKLNELHSLVNAELKTLQGLIDDNVILVTIGRNEKIIPTQAKNWAATVLDQQEDIEIEIQALTTTAEVNGYEIIIE